MRLPTFSGGSGPRFARHVGIAAPFLLCNVDSDVIAPIGPSSLSGLSAGERAFEPLRYLSDGSENSEFVLNQEPYRNASILLAGENFGAGSAPESAVARLMAFGIRVVLAPSFGSDFQSNCVASGMLAMPLSEEVIVGLADWAGANPRVGMLVDLEQQMIECSGMEPISFSIDPRVRNKLLLGLNDLDEMLQHTENVRALRNEDRKRRPWIYDWQP